MSNNSPRPFHLTQGELPLLISVPHVGTCIPPDIAQHMTSVAQRLDDTDWHVDRLYGFALDIGGSLLTAEYSRYVIDLNRSPEGVNLYPGQNSTGLCPVDTFSEEPLYVSGYRLDKAEIDRRRQRYWQPYHDALMQELARLKARHGYVLLWDAHSIRSRVPRFFEGQLPDLNFGTADGESALPGLIDTVSDRLVEHQHYRSIIDGRFKGGYITRHYGDPKNNVHAIQLELAQTTYMEEVPPYQYDENKAQALMPVLEQVVTDALSFLATYYSDEMNHPGF